MTCVVGIASGARRPAVAIAYRDRAAPNGDARRGRVTLRGAAIPMNDVVTARCGRPSLVRLSGSGADNQDQAFFA